MIIWSKNQKLPQDSYNRVVKLIESSHKNKTQFYTSYDEESSLKNNPSPTFRRMYNILNPFYREIIIEMMKEVGLYHQTPYIYNMWVQMYNSNNTNSHAPHNHFADTRQVLSWVHFIQVPRQRCFYFLNSKEEKIYPRQNTGDFITYPSWALHGVDFVKRKNFNRIIAAGNIQLN
jgi:hypothetical protein